MSDNGMLIVISGPSGSGKGTVVKELSKDDKYALSISMTTREKRPNEINGKDYFFCTKEEFENIKSNNGFLEHAEFIGNMYGTPKSYVNEKIKEGKAVILEIDVNGALQVKQLFGECILIFLMAPTKKILRERLVGRNTEEPLIIERRLKKVDEEIKLIEKYDYLIINDEVKNAIEGINNIICAERLKTKNNEKNILKFKEC